MPVIKHNAISKQSYAGTLHPFFKNGFKKPAVVFGIKNWNTRVGAIIVPVPIFLIIVDLLIFIILFGHILYEEMEIEMRKWVQGQ